MAKTPRKPPPTTPEANEDHLINLAYSLAEKQLADGTASPTTINHFLKLGSTRAELELEALTAENRLRESRAASLESQTRSEDKYQQVIEAIKRYNGVDEDEEYDFL